MPLAFIFGPPAVGKMSVGHELEKLTGFKLFHNHMTIDMVKQVLDVKDPVFGKLVEDLRIRILTALAESTLKGVIFTAGLDFDEPDNMEFVNRIGGIFPRFIRRRIISNLWLLWRCVWKEIKPLIDWSISPRSGI